MNEKFWPKTSHKPLIFKTQVLYLPGAVSGYKAHEKATWGLACASVWLVAPCKLMGTVWQEDASLPSQAGGCSEATDELGVLVHKEMVVTKPSRPAEVWGELRVNYAHMSDIVLELRPGGNFPFDEDWKGLKASFSSLLQMHGAWSQPWLPANVLSKCLPAIVGTCEILRGLWFLQYPGSPCIADEHH